MSVSASEALASLGFTDLESQIYAFLLTESPATGYRIAQAIAKPVANTYKSIQSLERKGAISVDDDKSRQCRPVPSEDLLGRLSREFEVKRVEAQQALASLGGRRETDGIHNLKTREAVVQQAASLLSEAKESAHIQVSSSLIPSIASAMKDARGRGVRVQVRSNEAVPDTDLDLQTSVELGANWPGEAIVLAADGQSSMFALVDRWGAVVQGAWSRSPFMSLVLLEGMSATACLSELRARVEEGAGMKRIAKTLGACEPTVSTAGFKALSEELL